MKTSYQPTTLYETPAAQKRDGYAAWLMDFSFASVRLTGSDAIFDLSLMKPARRWFLAGLSPVEAVRKRQTHYRLGHVAEVAFPDSCIGCNRPNSTRGGQFCSKCRAD